MKDKKLYTKEYFDYMQSKIKNLLEECQNVDNGRSYEYEHNDFQLVEYMDQYFVMTEEYLDKSI